MSDDGIKELLSAMETQVRLNAVFHRWIEAISDRVTRLENVDREPDRNQPRGVDTPPGHE
jgi:hypothetical protein